MRSVAPGRLVSGGSFLRVVARPFPEVEAALTCWCEDEDDHGAGRPAALSLEGMELSAEEIRCGIGLRVRSFGLSRTIPMKLSASPWCPASISRLELYPQRRVRPTRRYFRAGHRLLDDVRARLEAEQARPEPLVPGVDVAHTCGSAHAKIVVARLGREGTAERLRLAAESRIPGYLARIPGCERAYWMVNRNSGSAVLMTLWPDRSSLEAARAVEGRERARLTEDSDISPVAVMATDVIDHRRTDPEDGPGHPPRFGLMTWLTGLSTRRDQLVPPVRDEVMPLLEGIPGFHSGYLMADEHGNGICLSLWVDGGSVRFGGHAGMGVHRRLKAILGCVVDHSEDFEVVAVAHVPVDRDEWTDDMIASAGRSMRSQPASVSPPSGWWWS